MFPECLQKVCAGPKSLTIFNNEISFGLFGGLQTFQFLYSAVCVVSGLSHLKRVSRGWGHMYKKCRIGLKGLNMFNY